MNLLMKNIGVCVSDLNIPMQTHNVKDYTGESKGIFAFVCRTAAVARHKTDLERRVHSRPLRPQ